MDGTLLNSKKQLSATTIAGLIKAQKNGIRLALASGRSANRLHTYAQQLSLDKHQGLLIEGNGVGVVDFGDDTHIILNRMQEAEAVEVLTLIKAVNAETIIMGSENAFIILPDGQSESCWMNRMQPEGKMGRVIEIIKDLSQVNEPINKICICECDEKIEQVRACLIQSDYWCGLVDPGWLEITPQRISKGNGLKAIMNKYHLNSDEVICFGDGENDASMFKVAKYGIAMGNALGSLKTVCYDETSSNDNDGIINYLKKHEVI